MAKDISLFAAGEGGEDPVDSLLRLAGGGTDTDDGEEAVAGAPESSSASRPRLKLVSHESVSPPASTAQANASNGLMYDKLIAVLVGPAKKQFDLHRTLFCGVSPYVADALNGEGKERERRRVYYVRHNLQKFLLPIKRQPKPVELLAADGLLKKLEGLGDLEYTSNIKATRIHKVLKAALKSPAVPWDDQWHLKKRMHLLLSRYKERLAIANTTDEAAGTETAADHAKDSLSLPNVLPDTFDNFVRWLYRQKLESSKALPNDLVSPLSPAELVQLYTLADFLQIPALQNLITDSLQSISPSTEAFEAIIPYVSSNPTTGAKLLSLVVRMYAQRASASEVRHAADSWMEKPFLVELAAVLLEDREKGQHGRRPYVGKQCEFHVHDKANPRCA